MKSIGTIQGYAVVFGDVAEKPEERGAYETIKPRDLTVSPKAFLDGNHFTFDACAFVTDGTLRIGEDDTGIYFEADLPETAAGFNSLNGLQEVLALGVSLSFQATEAAYDGDIEAISRGTINSISIVQAGAGAYGAARCWLADFDPMDPHARQLQQRFRNREKPTATQPAGAAPRPSKRGRWLNHNGVRSYFPSGDEIERAALSLGIAF